jgi:hypothetical protein
MEKYFTGKLLALVSLQSILGSTVLGVFWVQGFLAALLWDVIIIGTV